MKSLFFIYFLNKMHIAWQTFGVYGLIGIAIICLIILYLIFIEGEYY